MSIVEKPAGYFGRDDEWRHIGECIKTTDNLRHLVYVVGPGGVGKTALLDLIFETYADLEAPYVVPDAIDFDDLTLRLPVNFMERVVLRLGGRQVPSPFDHFWQLYSQDVGRDLARRGRHQDELRKAFVVGLNELAAKKRIVLLIDTLEKAPLWFPVFFANAISAVSNLVIVLVGRPQSQDIVETLKSSLSPLDDLPNFDQASFEWSGLDPALCEEYFAGRQEFRQLTRDLALLGIEISLDLKQRIWTLARGIPFQVNLVAGMLRYLESGDEALSRQVSQLLEQIQSTGIADLEHNLDLRQRFQQALVAPFVLNYGRPELAGDELDYAWLTSRIILLIAHVNHYMAHALGGFDASVLAELDDALDEAKVQFALDYIEENRATQFTFVKVFRGPAGEIGGIGLHDEMVRMLNDFAWLRLDPPGRLAPRRKEISAKLVDYYDRRCLNLYGEGKEKEHKQPSPKTWERAVSSPQGQALLLARVFHSIYESFEKGWSWAYTLSDRIFTLTDFDVLLYESVEAYIQATRRAEDPDIQAKMNVWKAAAQIARNELVTARELLESSINLWLEQYQADETAIEQLEENRAILENSRLALLRQQREQPRQFDHVQHIIDSYDAKLAEIQRLIQSKTQFRDLERAYTSLGFTYRLEGKWQQAIDNYYKALKYSRWLGNLETIAELANNMANVNLLWGRLTNAAQYGQVGASIRKHLNAARQLGHSYYILGMINWRVGNTYESKTYLRRARDCYQDDPVALARLALYEGYTYYRIGDTKIGLKSLEDIPGFRGIPQMQSYLLLEQARDVFEQHEYRDDLAWTYNVLSRAHRRDDEFEEAERTAKRALELTQNRLRKAEAHLSLCMLYYRWGLRRFRDGDKEGALETFRLIDEHYAHGYKLADEGQFVALLSVYEGVKGNVEYERGADDPAHYKIAFQHYLRECQIAARNKNLRFERALNEVVADRLARMPFDLAMEYADVLADAEAWKAKNLEQEYSKLKTEVEELKLFLGLPEREKIDEMENRFNQCMRVGDYDDALKQAKISLQQFYRYNWSIDTVRVLLKTAQAYRKVAQYTSARRSCKQTLLIIEGLEQQEGANSELIRQKAHANFTMGRILWEIGNTAEAATHFRLARETYLEHREHPDLTIAREMREGLARSVQYEGFMRFRIGDWDQALDFLDWAEQEYRAMEAAYKGEGYRRRLVRLLNLKARIYRDRNAKGDVETAHEILEETLDLAKKVGDKYALAECYLTFMILEYQESHKPNNTKAETLEFLGKAQHWYETGAEIVHANHYTLLQAVYEGMLGNVLFDRLQLQVGDGERANLEPAFDRYLEECRWGSHFEKRRFFRSLDLLMQRLSQLSSDEIRFYIEYIRQGWNEFAREGKLPGPKDGDQADAVDLVSALGEDDEQPSEYEVDMNNFCDLVEEFSEYIAN